MRQQFATIYAEPDDNVIFLDELEEHEHSQIVKIIQIIKKKMNLKI